jgi:hypothetical protein
VGLIIVLKESIYRHNGTNGHLFAVHLQLHHNETVVIAKDHGVTFMTDDTATAYPGKYSVYQSVIGGKRPQPAHKISIPSVHDRVLIGAIKC